MRITVAICTWNRCELLRQTLDQLTRAVVPTGTTLEVIVVNNNCTDATDQIIGEFGDRLPVRRLFESSPGLSYARNAALSAATGDYVVFTDDDVLVSESWLREFEAATRAFPEAAAIGGIIEPWFPEPPDPELMEAFSELKRGFCGLDHGLEGGPLPDGLFIWGANMAFRSGAIRDLRFDPNLGPSPTSTVCADETDFLRRIRASGGGAVWWPGMRVRHYVLPSRMTLEYLLRHAIGKGTESVLIGPVQWAPLLGGAPRWLWRRYVEAWVNCLASYLRLGELLPYPVTLSGSWDTPSSARVRILRWRREVLFLRGMIAGYRQLVGRRREPHPEVAAPATRSVPTKRLI